MGKRLQAIKINVSIFLAKEQDKTNQRTKKYQKGLTLAYADNVFLLPLIAAILCFVTKRFAVRMIGIC